MSASALAVAQGSPAYCEESCSRQAWKEPRGRAEATASPTEEASPSAPSATPSSSSSSSSSSLSVLLDAPPKPLCVVKLEEDFEVRVFIEGTGAAKPQNFVEAHLVGRLPSGCVFESTAGKGQGPMRMELGRNSIIPGMERGLRELTLGSVAELHIPGRLGYRHIGVPRVVPPNSTLIFEVELVNVDGRKVEQKSRVVSESAAEGNAQSNSIRHPWWMARVERPKPTRYYLSFGRHFASLGAEGKWEKAMHRAVPIVRLSRKEAPRWEDENAPCIIAGVQDGWKSKEAWNFDWFRQHLGSLRQLAKWQGPVFTKQENLWDSPVWECSVREYLDYMASVDVVDPSCDARNADACPRLYLNGWAAFKQLPWLREYVINPTFIGDISGDLIAENEELRECFMQGLTKGYQAPPEEERRQGIDDEYWELTKLFLSPKGAITRLHFDNGGAHGWLTQVRGRKLFICYPPSDTDNLDPFAGDEGLMNGTWLDPLDEQVDTEWPMHKKATPYIGVVQEGETVLMPKGWWHYAASLEPSLTVMRNFYTERTKQEYIRRKDDGLENAVAQHVLKANARLKNQPDEVLKEIAHKTVLKMREGFKNRSGPHRWSPEPGGKPPAKSAASHSQ